MNHFSSVTLKFLTAVIVAASVLGPGAARAEQGAPPPDTAQSITCTINLQSNTNTCWLPGITAIITRTGGAPANSTQLWLKVSLGIRTTAKFTVRYGAVPSGWTVNIGDSPTNNGWGGDAATQSNDAEMQVVGQSFAVYGRDGAPSYPLLGADAVGLGPGSAVTFTVTNESLCWDLPATDACVISPYLYALNGQPDFEPGGVNYDIYAGFNRVISGPGSRVGSGVASVTIEILYPNPFD